MTSVFVSQVKNTRTAIMENEQSTRRRLSVDTVSLIETDGEMPSVEETFEGSQMVLEILKTLSTDTERFMALCLDHGFSKAEIAFILQKPRYQITRDVQKMRIKLKPFRTGLTILGKART